MRLVIIMQTAGHVVAVVECPSSMSDGAIALAWAKANGYEKFPSDLYHVACDLTTAGTVFRAITPISELNELERGADEHFNTQLAKIIPQ